MNYDECGKSEMSSSGIGSMDMTDDSASEAASEASSEASSIVANGSKKTATAAAASGFSKVRDRHHSFGALSTLKGNDPSKFIYFHVKISFHHIFSSQTWK